MAYCIYRKASHFTLQGQKLKQIIMKQTIIILSVLLLSSCSPRIFPVERDTTSTTKIVERIVYRDSLIEVLMPQGEASSSGHVGDTTDIIETSLAVSGVEIRGSQFRHWLKHKTDAAILHHAKLPQREVTSETDRRMLVRDIQYVEKKLSGWQKAMMAGGYGLLMAVVVLVVLGILRWRKIL